MPSLTQRERALVMYQAYHPPTNQNRIQTVRAEDLESAKRYLEEQARQRSYLQEQEEEEEEERETTPTSGTDGDKSPFSPSSSATSACEQSLPPPSTPTPAVETPAPALYMDYRSLEILDGWMGPFPDEEGCSLADPFWEWVPWNVSLEGTFEREMPERAERQARARKVRMERERQMLVCENWYREGRFAGELLPRELRLVRENWYREERALEEDLGRIEEEMALEENLGRTEESIERLLLE